MTRATRTSGSRRNMAAVPCRVGFVRQSITVGIDDKGATHNQRMCGRTFGLRQLAHGLGGLLAAMLLAGCQVTAPPASFPAGAGELLVKLSGLHTDQGVVIVSLFAGAGGFPDEVSASQTTVTVPIRAGQAEARFAAVPYGEYALSVLHDEDGDGRMATGLFGAPREGFGFSGRPDYRFGHPDFTAASFLLLSPRREIEIVLRYETARRQHQEEGRGGELGRPQQ